jgi:hypothetical protein
MKQIVQDFANQVYWWKDYTAACKLARKPKGLYASPEIGEYMAGQVWDYIYI